MTPLHFWEGQAPLVIAHRGASAYRHENTLEAFKLAVELGADGFEFDVRYLKDRSLIVLHDSLISGRPVAWMSLKDVRELGSTRGSTKVQTPPHLPTLREVLGTFAGLTRLNVEVKYEGFSRWAGVKSLVEALACSNCIESTLVSSFNPFLLRQIFREEPSIPLGLLYAGTGRLTRMLGQWAAPLTSLHPRFDQLTSREVEFAHSRKMKILTWTVNEQADVLRCKELGVDGIITDYPDRARQWIEEG